MSLLEYLLGPPKLPTGDGSRRLLVDQDVPMVLDEDASGEHLVLASVPGRMPQDDWLRSLQAPWRVDGEPLDCGARSAVCVEPVTGRTLLICFWPRAVLTPDVFRTALTAQANAHRAWRSLLAPTPDQSY